MWSQNQHNNFSYSVLGIHGGSFTQWVSKVKLLMEPLRYGLLQARQTQCLCLSECLIVHACPVLQASARRSAYTGGEVQAPKTFDWQAATAAGLSVTCYMTCFEQVDGNDVVFFPCNRSIAESFRLLDASIAFMGVAHQHPDYHIMELFPKVQPVTPHPFPSALSEFLAGANRYRSSQSTQQ